MRNHVVPGLFSGNCFGDELSRVSSKCSCITTGVERFSLDLLQAVKNKESALEVGNEGVLRL